MLTWAQAVQAVSIRPLTVLARLAFAATLAGTELVLGDIPAVAVEVVVEAAGDRSSNDNSLVFLKLMLNYSGTSR